MSYRESKVDTVRAYAESLDQGIDTDQSKTALVQELTRLGFLEADFDAWVSQDRPQEVKQDQVIVYMQRQNYEYQTWGFTFTREHPYLPMTRDEANNIFASEDGFRLATPQEVSDYYS